MSTYQELKGLKVKYLSADTSGDRAKEGELFYNSTSGNLKTFVTTAAWHSGANLITARSNGGGAGTIILQDNTDSTSLFQADVPTGDVFSMNIPEDGILFPGGMKVSTITNIDAATLLIDK